MEILLDRALMVENTLILFQPFHLLVPYPPPPPPSLFLSVPPNSHLSLVSIILFLAFVARCVWGLILICVL